MHGKNTVRLCIPRKTNDQMGGRVNEFAGFGVNRTRPSVEIEGVEDIDWMPAKVSMGYFDPKTTTSECLVVILVGYFGKQLT